MPQCINMSDAIKKVWVNESGADLYSLSIESARVSEPHMRVKVVELVFPANPTPEHPLRHTINLGLLTEEDLHKIYETLFKFLYK